MEKSRVYTPQISGESAFLLRRIAWAAERPMTYALDGCVHGLVEYIDRSLLCEACRDRRCLECPVGNVASGLDSIMH